MTKAERLNNIEETDWIVTDQNTGEIIDTVKEGDSIRHLNEYEKYFDTKFNKNCKIPWLRAYDMQADKLADVLSGAELKLFMKLLKYVSYDDAVLKHNGKRLTTKEISTLTGINYDTCRRLIRGLINRGVLATAMTGTYDNPNKKHKSLLLNPFIFYKGQKMSREVISIFADSKWN